MIDSALAKIVESETKNMELHFVHTESNNRIIVFICTDAWAPICIFLQVSGQNESVHIKSIDTLEVNLYQRFRD